MKKSNQKGFTLSEMLIVILIIAVLVGISAIATNCAFKYTDFEKASLNGNQIMTTLESIYADTGKIPVGEPVDISEVDEKVLNSVKEAIPQIEAIIGDKNLYNLDSSKLKFKGDDLTKDDVESFYVVYVEDSNKSYSKYNLTLVSKIYCDTCSSASFSHILGKTPYAGVSESLKFDLDESYLACPNSGLAFKLGDECEEVKE